MDFKKNILYMLPTILISIYFLYQCIFILVANYYEGGMTIPTLIFSIGGALWIGYWILFENNIYEGVIEKTTLCILMPVNLVLQYYIIWGLLGV
jgi:hypothetical protein